MFNKRSSSKGSFCKLSRLLFYESIFKSCFVKFEIFPEAAMYFLLFLAEQSSFMTKNILIIFFCSRPPDTLTCSSFWGTFFIHLFDRFSWWTLEKETLISCICSLNYSSRERTNWNDPRKTTAFNFPIVEQRAWSAGKKVLPLILIVLEAIICDTNKHNETSPAML